MSRCPRALGEVEVVHRATLCGDGRCTALRVTCPEVKAPARAWVKVQEPDGEDFDRGTMVFMIGGGGRGMYQTHFGEEGRRLMAELREEGIRTVQLCWIDSWLAAAPGEEAGPRRLACRSATLARWIHEHVHGGDPTATFAATGNSGGATQIGYWLAHYGLKEILDAAVLSGGPPMTRLDWMVDSRGDGDEDCAFEPGWATAIVDGSFGHPPDLSGPYSRKDASYRETFLAASICSPEADLCYRECSVSFVFGEQEHPAVLAQGRAFRRAMMEEGSASVREEIVPDTAHQVARTRQGADRIRDLLLLACEGGR